MAKRPFAAVMTLLLCLSILAATKIGFVMAENSVTLSDYELSTQFAYQYGPGGSSVTTIADLPGVGVEFNFTGLGTSQATGASDNFDISLLAGGDPDVAGYRGNFSRFTHYDLAFKNQGTTAVDVNLYMNTGYTGAPFYDGTRDTFWKCNSVNVGVGETKVVTLDFSAAICYGASDDPNPAWRYGDGETHPVNRLDEVSNIGFEVLGTGTGSLVVSGSASGTTLLYINPSTVKEEYTGVGSVFEVAVKTDEVTDLYGFDIKVSWDNALLSLDHVDYDSTPTSPLKFVWGPTAGSNYSVVQSTVGANSYRLAAVSLRDGFTGSHALFVLGFRVLDPQTNSKKTCMLHFEASYDKLSNSNAQSITHTTTDGSYEIWGSAPTLDMIHSGSYSRICRELDEEFTVTVGVSNAVNLAGYGFEIHYDTSMIDYISHTIVWGSGTISHNEAGGIVTASVTGGGGGSGAYALVTITFKSDPNFKRIWKDPSTGQPSNIFTSPTGIYFQSITLHYTSLPDIGYTKGGGGDGRVNVGPDFAYTFSPIRGDLNNDGDVDISDLSWEASFFDSPKDDLNLIGPPGGLIDIFDLVVIAGNFWYHYVPPPP